MQQKTRLSNFWDRKEETKLEHAIGLYSPRTIRLIWTYLTYIHLSLLNLTPHKLISQVKGFVLSLENDAIIADIETLFKTYFVNFYS